MSTPQAKRRRLNDATKTLHKPFKSPFRTPLRPTFGSDPPSSDPPEIHASASVPNSIPGNVSSANANTIPPQPNTSQPKPSEPASSTITITKPLPSRINTSAPSRTLSKKGAIKPSLTREIMQLRNEIQILSQAQTLATSTKDDDLVVLIDKWRVASRAAAEELFATTRDKVNRMGGVGAWKAKEKESRDRHRKWDQEEMEAERERLEEARENGEVNDEDYDKYADIAEDDRGAVKEEETFKGADDDSFTMDMMLTTLNVDLDLIGYNKEAQRWEG